MGAEMPPKISFHPERRPAFAFLRLLGLHEGKRLTSSASVRAVLMRALAIVCALHLSGAHWAALQTVAWTGMLVTRSQTEGVEEAVRTTFDGQHPCKLCVVVNKGHQQEREGMQVAIVQMLSQASFLIPQTVYVPPPMFVRLSYGSRQCQGLARGKTPPTPPPRLA